MTLLPRVAPTTLDPASWRASAGRIGAIARRHGYVMLRSPHRLFDVTVWPLVDLLIFGSIGVFAGRLSAGGRTAAAFLAGIFLWHVVYQSSIALSTGFMEETWTRNLLNLMVTPVREVEYAIGVALFGFVKLGIGMTLVAIGAAVAFGFNVGTVGWGLLPVAAILLCIGWVIALFVIGLVLRFGSGAEAMAWGVLFVVMPLSGVFTPVDVLPGALQPVARLLPTTRAFEVARDLVAGEPLRWGELAWAAVLALVAVVLATAFVARMLAMFRRRGYVTRYS